MKATSFSNQRFFGTGKAFVNARCVVVLLLLMALPLIAAERLGQRGDRGRGGAVGGGREPGGFGRGRTAGGHFEANRPAMVDRFTHGSLRHAETHIVPRAPEIRRGPERHGFERHDVFVHRDVDVDFHGPHLWHDFVLGRHLPHLPLGFITLNIGGAPYYYDDGIYYQPIQGGYQEVYPPVGAAIPQPPDGAIEVYAGNQVYYYAGGGFYVQQPDGNYAIAPTPLGVVVPELPPEAVQVSVNGRIAYQFNGIYYQPVFVNGVTEYQTFAP
jgi:hypothetical protein